MHHRRRFARCTCRADPALLHPFFVRPFLSCRPSRTDRPVRVLSAQVAADVLKDFGKIDILIHSLANGPEARRVPSSDHISPPLLSAVSPVGSASPVIVRKLPPPNLPCKVRGLTPLPLFSPQPPTPTPLTQYSSQVVKPLLETSRKGYLAAMSASSYSFVSLLQRFGPIMNRGGSSLSLTYIASEAVIPGYGGGMSSAKAALESDTRVLAYEAGRKYGIRVNTISAGPLGSRAARAIGFIGDMINYSMSNAPLAEKELQALEVGSATAFLVSPLASAITGVTLYVDNGLHAMGVAGDSAAITSGQAAAAAAAAAAPKVRRGRRICTARASALAAQSCIF